MQQRRKLARLLRRLRARLSHKLKISGVIFTIRALSHVHVPTCLSHFLVHISHSNFQSPSPSGSPPVANIVIASEQSHVRLQPCLGQQMTCHQVSMCLECGLRPLTVFQLLYTSYRLLVFSTYTIHIFCKKLVETA